MIVLIIGGGIGGLSAALALQGQGFTVRVFERAPAFAEVGAGLTVGPNMMHGLACLGVAPAVLSVACIPAHGGVLDLTTAELRVANARGDTPRQRYGQPYVQVHRAELHAIDGALATLPNEQREAVLLVMVEGYSYREAAEIVGCPVGTLNSRLVRGRDALLALLGEAA